MKTSRFGKFIRTLALAAAIAIPTVGLQPTNAAAMDDIVFCTRLHNAWLDEIETMEWCFYQWRETGEQSWQKYYMHHAARVDAIMNAYESLCN